MHAPSRHRQEHSCMHIPMHIAMYARTHEHRHMYMLRAHIHAHMHACICTHVMQTLLDATILVFKHSITCEPPHLVNL